MLKKIPEKTQNFMAALLPVLLLGVLAGLFFDYYYDLNDDVLMKDILAGVYTGVPESRNIQMLWLISAFISALYHMAGGLPWYGLFLCGCHFGCIFLIARRSAALCTGVWKKVLAAVVCVGVFAAFFMEHLIFAQYTVTCTLLGATAAFLFYTTDITLEPAAFIKKNIPAVLLVFTAYQLRSEMLMLVLPMICVAGVCKWGSEDKIFTKPHGVKYLTVIGLILLGIGLGQAAHELAYSSSGWRAFTEFFNNRTELYDFQAPPDYEENQAFYESIGLTESEKILFDNYNFGMDDEIDEKLIGEVASYAKGLRSQRTEPVSNLKEKGKEYFYRFLHGRGETGSDYPWNYLVILGYAAVFITAFLRENKKKSVLFISWKLLFLFAVRTVLWMYILWGERSPDRITHSLYLMEFCILAAMLFMEWKSLSEGRKKTRAGGLFLVLFGLLALLVLPENMEAVTRQQQYREVVNAPYLELYQYLTEGENQENFYFMDVYSSVAYSEKMFENVDNSLDNYDIMGGWACKSPLWRKKLAAYHIVSMEQALLEREDVYFVKRKDEDMEWLPAYYEGHGKKIQPFLIDTISGEFEIYSIEEVKE